MNKQNIEEKFEEYFNEIEVYCLRSERFYADLMWCIDNRTSSDNKKMQLMKKWLEAAFEVGFKTGAYEVAKESLSEHQMKERSVALVNAMVGDLADDWWSRKNKAFDGMTPAGMWIKDHKRVYGYLLKSSEGEW